VLASFNYCGGGITSTEKDPQRDLLKLFAYGQLANLWITLATREAMSEKEAKALLGVQEAVIKEFEKTLQAYLDFPSMKAFGEYITRYKVRLS
jgi:hypothetical protein